MRRSPKSVSQRLSSESQRLIHLAQALMRACSRLEERAWERDLDTHVQKLLRNDHQDSIEAALDTLFKSRSDAYDVLMDAVETACESCLLEHDGQQYEALLIAAPILAWTRFSIPSGPISADMTMTLSAHLYAHVLAPDAKLALAPMLYSIDQLPRNHVQTFATVRRMAQHALSGTQPKPAAGNQETVPFLADVRYLLAVAVAPLGAPLFRWQASANPAEREEALMQWRTQAQPNIERLMPGCGIELMRPDAYFTSCREADKSIRPASIRAAVHYLTHTLNVAPERLSAIIGGFGEPDGAARIDEFRISFALRPRAEVVYGVVWPLYGDEDAAGEPQETGPRTALTRASQWRSPLEEIVALLQESGIVHIKCHDDFFPVEFCDDCGAPLCCDLDGDLVHPEMPEDITESTPHLH